MNAVQRNNVIIDGTKYTAEGDYTAAKGSTVTVKRYASKGPIYFNGNKMVENTSGVASEVSYSFTVQKPTLILGWYDAVYIIEQGA